MKRIRLNIFIFIAGLAIAGIAVFAQELGIDHNEAWGWSRVILLIVGFCVLLFSLAPQEKFLFLLNGYLARQRIRYGQNIGLASRLLKSYFFILPVVGIVFAIYIWFASVGSWTTWYPRTEYYSLLARGFQKHQLHLPVKPSEKLLALPDPYDPSQRIGVGEPLDFSLYQEKFYLYWGPVPALILVVLKLMVPQNLPDVSVVFGFLGGLFLLQVILVVFVWGRYFSGLPNWVLIMAVFLVGLAGPFTWMIGLGGIYEAAIAGGQFFLMAGFLTALLAITKSSSSNITLILTGSLWTLAIGTRLTLILPIGFMMLMVVYMLWKKWGVRPGDLSQRIICLGSPVFLGLALLAWYNWARFGSISETGLIYQMAGVHLQKHGDEIMSYRYIVQNLYNYFLAPFRVDEQFPYIFSNYGSIESILPFYNLPEFYHANPITGLLFVVPFILFSFIPFRMMFQPNAGTHVQHNDGSERLFEWILFVLYGAFFLTLFFLLVFFWGAMRYVADFMPVLLIVSIIGYFQSYKSVQGRVWEKYVAVAGIFLGGTSILVSIVLGLAETILAFQEIDPTALHFLGLVLK